MPRSLSEVKPQVQRGYTKPAMIAGFMFYITDAETKHPQGFENPVVEVSYRLANPKDATQDVPAQGNFRLGYSSREWLVSLFDRMYDEKGDIMPLEEIGPVTLENKAYGDMGYWDIVETQSGNGDF